MNKGLRQEITKRKHNQRCKARGINPSENYSFKHQTKPCSCIICDPHKYDPEYQRMKQKQKEILIQMMRDAEEMGLYK